ncbi:putative tRNA pseudouridine synthase Pus10 [Chionoecetes opilio]|uniref:tRNA pseudouridine(55) synthase n=1 Tax=Chionoecetes opilio TaxID=41210 RepID=A0A8J8WKV6_CHIOP|nr:putative tRNA pseudouridine synthase Pus10 [Chionoecetes opilio]
MVRCGASQRSAATMLGRDAHNFLEEAGCCRRCTLIFLGNRSDDLYGDSSTLYEATEAAIKRLNGQSDEVQDLTQNSSTSNTSTEKCLSEDELVIKKTEENENSSKKQKYAVCVGCIGVLQWGASKEAIARLSQAIKDGGHDAEGFSLSLSLPASISLRVHRLWSLLLKDYPQFPVAKGREDHIGTIKDVWKNVVGPQLEVATGKTFIHGTYHGFVLNVVCSYVNDLEDCKIMNDLCKKVFATRQKQHRKYANSIYSKQAIDAAFKKLSDSEVLKVCPAPPVTPSEGITFASLYCQQAPMYMAGRYNKYSRDLPQTPWFVEGERKLGSSVQELMCDILNKTVHAEEIKFSSSGREDVDVRCLGNGRPFVVEFINPQRTKLSRDKISSLQRTINDSTKLIRVRDLQIVEKKDLKNLKEGEEEKTKAYCAVCIAPKGYDGSALEGLSKVTQLVIHQKTPLRVLHRRPLATRPRTILSMTAHPIDQHFFKAGAALHLTTQAGTYIKEFVHGDLGRTVPNLGGILDCEVDIIALDVEATERLVFFHVDDLPSAHCTSAEPGQACARPARPSERRKHSCGRPTGARATPGQGVCGVHWDNLSKTRHMKPVEVASSATGGAQILVNPGRMQDHDRLNNTKRKVLSAEQNGAKEKGKQRERG